MDYDKQMRAVLGEGPIVEAAEAGDYVGAVIAYSRHYDHVSIVEIKRMLSAYMETEGHKALTFGGDENLILWAGASEEFVGILRDALSSSELAVKPTVPLTYLMDGGMLNMPVAKRPPKNGYKEPHWLPVVLRPAEKEDRPPGHR